MSLEASNYMAGVTLSTCCVDGVYVNSVLATYVDHLICQWATSDETFIVQMEENTKVCTRISFHDMYDLPISFMFKPEHLSACVCPDFLHW